MPDTIYMWQYMISHLCFCISLYEKCYLNEDRVNQKRSQTIQQSSWDLDFGLHLWSACLNPCVVLHPTGSCADLLPWEPWGLCDCWALEVWCPNQHRWLLVLIRTYFERICFWRYGWSREEWKSVGVWRWGNREMYHKCLRRHIKLCFNT